jgi:hypothetical protein
MISSSNSVRSALAYAKARGCAPTVIDSVDTRLTHRQDINPRLVRLETRDGLQTFDQATVDSAGVFLVGELERLDPRLHMPLVSYTWARDIDLREDVTMGDEESSFTNSMFGAPGGIPGSNKAWAGKGSSAIVGVSLDIGKTAMPLPIWAMQLSWTLPELQSAQRLGRPVDSQKFDAMQIKYQMDIDEETYMGDTILGLNGMFNHANLSNVGNAVTGAWATATPAQILADVNSLLNNIYGLTGYAVIPNRLLVDPTSFTMLVSTLISSAGNISILKFLLENNATIGVAGEPLKILPCKWLTGTNNSGKGPTATNSMFAYVKDPMRVRLPLVPLQRTPIEFRDIRQITTYFGRIGSVEMVYPEVCGRRSNLG